MMRFVFPFLIALSCTPSQVDFSPTDLSLYQTDPLNCGRAGNVCPRNDMGISGPYRFICCGGQCFDQNITSDHCGTCMVMCGGMSCCNGNCVSQSSYLTDPFNCGKCGNKCRVSSCFNGQCP